VHDFDRIAESARIARDGVLKTCIDTLARGIDLYYGAQLFEGMSPLPDIAGALCKKYCGGGHGGYALYLFPDEGSRSAALASHDALRPIEPFCRV
jgi:hypothetical protein